MLRLAAVVLLLGLAYKANVDDMRESPTFALMVRIFDFMTVMRRAYCPLKLSIGIVRADRSFGFSCRKSMVDRQPIISG